MPKEAMTYPGNPTSLYYQVRSERAGPILVCFMDASQTQVFRRTLGVPPRSALAGSIASRQGNRASEAFDECSQEVIAPSCLFELHAV